jgi:hypothetical protein
LSATAATDVAHRAKPRRLTADRQLKGGKLALPVRRGNVKKDTSWTTSSTGTRLD